MKILLINSRYYEAAGPEKYMFEVSKLLTKKGHKVIPFALKNSKNKKTRYNKHFANSIQNNDKFFFEDFDKNVSTYLSLLERQFYSFHVRNKLEQLIKISSPDIAYILHHQNRLSPSVIDACKKFKMPVVLRISDFSLICPKNNLLRDSEICEKCISGSLLNCIKYKCVKNSYFGSAIKVSALYFHKTLGIYNKVDHVVSPTKVTIQKIKEFFSKTKISHVPTFVTQISKANNVGKYILYVGRIEPEKGLIYAIQAVANTGYNFKIVGYSHSGYDKVLKNYILKNRIKNVEFAGSKFGKELENVYRNCRFVILPVIWYENMPNTCLEAMSHGKPVLCSNIGSMKEIIKDDSNGILFKPKNVADLQNKIKLLFQDDKLCKKLGKNAINDIIINYNSQNHYNNLINIFISLLNQNET